MYHTQTTYQHFRSDEKDYVDRILEWKRRVENTYIPFVTPFLNPREQFIAQSLCQDNSLHIFFYGGSKHTERCRALITYADDYEWHDFDLAVLDIHYPSKFATLKHSQILGSLLGSGIKRDGIGDIVTDGQNWQLVTTAPLAKVFQRDVQKIGAVSVTFNVLDTPAITITPHENVDVVQTTVSSLRLDVVLATAFHLSRQVIKTAVEKELVTLNWKVETRGHHEVTVHDTLSLRKYGRVKLMAIQGMSKSGKQKIVLHVIKNRK